MLANVEPELLEKVIEEENGAAGRRIGFVVPEQRHVDVVPRRTVIDSVDHGFQGAVEPYAGHVIADDDVEGGSGGQQELHAEETGQALAGAAFVMPVAQGGSQPWPWASMSISVTSMHQEVTEDKLHYLGKSPSSPGFSVQ